MDDKGVSAVIGGILTVFILMALVGIIFGFLMGFGSNTPSDGYQPRYGVVNTEAVPALSASDTWDADSIKIHFISMSDVELEYEEGANSGIENPGFNLIDPNGGFHKAVQSVTMHQKKLYPGAELYCFTLTSGVGGEYYITDTYSRIADDSTWGGSLTYPKAMAPGTWRVQILDEDLGVLIADEVVTV